MTEWPDYYILVDRVPFAVDVLTWGKWFGNMDNRRIGEDHIDHVRISTVFLGLDHNMRGVGDPVLFETMIFGGPLDNEQWRYCSYAEAERGHQEAVTAAKIAILPREATMKRELKAMAWGYAAVLPIAAVAAWQGDLAYVGTPLFVAGFLITLLRL